MENKGTLTKVLAIAGTAFVWFPILTPILISVIFFIREQVFQFDYLMPAELGLFAFGGGILLLVSAIRARIRPGIIAWGFGIAAAMLLGGQALAVITGLASGETEPVGWQWALVLGSLVLYSLAVAGIGIGGVVLLRDLFKPHQLSRKSH